MMRRSTRTFLKYLLLQIPGWVLVLILLFLLRSWIDLPVWLGVTVLSVWVVKDLVLFPFFRRSYEDDPASTGGERLVGTRGVVTTTLEPQGYIRVRGELWRAEVRTAESVPQGSVVRIASARGLTLSVERDGP